MHPKSNNSPTNTKQSKLPDNQTRLTPTHSPKNTFRHLRKDNEDIHQYDHLNEETIIFDRKYTQEDRYSPKGSHHIDSLIIHVNSNHTYTSNDDSSLNHAKQITKLPTPLNKPTASEMHSSIHSFNADPTDNSNQSDSSFDAFKNSVSDAPSDSTIVPLPKGPILCIFMIQMVSVFILISCSCCYVCICVCSCLFVRICVCVCVRLCSFVRSFACI